MSLTEFDATLQRLGQVRFALLRLHKALLDGERMGYEQEHGRVTNTEFFRLVLEDQRFAWLRPISQFIVQIDEALDAKEPITMEQASELLAQTKQLLRPAVTGSNLEQKYDQAIQRDPDIAFLHAEMMNMLVGN
ncbi:MULTISPECIES: hypothetical protein [Leptolyngbya]|jgi:hypothetical protein|uniref:Uncharacterized protein n=2 Tax=Leptolyngbya boryana TaxID=1184 RepID=A0A1Z4JCJ9_LEPBY|nr:MULTISPECIES: hypothetical protein [Leptolyngbya]BAY54489.1 hypothetical protein NIES2135_13060 [Leptolyngbya boryana NIES-2135]MBD1856754.1 hypothetical protein [Leptolyngbya sp. FACHB-1624]MBD2365484.1 hypothetical protein [Leptolyngbya sp. FACHB-161]MBD2371664.1 hypothetical protein [Leptolyngbya sp. FACHB-238]MBD2396089.1 hypothetical protein [Leptolyngbya sp. FACHB-239]